MIVWYSDVRGDIKGEIEINTLEDLQNFRKTIAFGQEIILSAFDKEENEIFDIEIYNDYKE